MSEDELIDQIIAILQNILESGEVLSDELLNEVAEVLSQTINQPAEESPRVGAQTAPVEAPVSESAELLWQLSGGQPQAFVSYLREVPDPALNALLEDPGQLRATIERLEREMPPEAMAGATDREDNIPHAQLQSSNVYGFRFNPSNKQLMVRFQNGSVYQYDGVPDLIFNLFSNGNASAKTSGKNRWGSWWKGKNPSLGAALNQYIKRGGYPYKKVK